jgi:hypothetical protein
MALDKKINITEGQVIFNNKVNQGHSHDGIGSAKIDLSSYSIFDLVPIVNETSATTRGRVQAGNENKLKTFIVNAVQERVLNPAGITLKANTIDAQRIIVDGTITSNLLSANIVLVNNVISSNNYVQNQSGWVISSNGDAEFINVNIRGNIYLSNTGGSSYNSSTTALFANNAGYFSLKDKFTWNPASNVLTLTGQITANSGAIGGWLIDSSGLSKEDSPAPTTIRATIYPSAISFINFAGSENYQSQLTADSLFFSDDNYYTNYRANGLVITDDATSTQSYFKHFGAILRGTMQIIGGNITTDQGVSADNVYSSSYITVGSTNNESANTTASAFGAYMSGQGFITASRPGVCLFINGTVSNAATNQQLVEFRRRGVQPGSAGIYSTNTTVQYSTTSDYRLKENITTIPDGITLVNRLNPVSFDWINNKKDNKVYGFIAHELAEVVPDAVANEKDDIDDDGNPKYQAVDSSFTIPIVVAGLKEAIAKIEELEARIQTLEGV